MTNATTNNSTENNDTNIEGVSVLKSLRSLMPHRVLSYSEALQRAELQANRLLSLHEIVRGPVPIEIVTELPRVRVEQSYDLPASGSAHWDGGCWVLTVNAAEFSLRQRFSVMHEFKLVLDHPTRHLIHSSDRMSEKVADFFAACVLMPKAWVKTAFYNERVQSVEALAEMFQVSPKAMSFRLSQLGLAVPVDRCASVLSRGTAREVRSYWPTHQSTRSTRYFRSLSRRPTLEGVSP
jgi:Zn-dependent peptidase ImmA (M78 family)